jgi:hypothetical protein
MSKYPRLHRGAGRLIDVQENGLGALVADAWDHMDLAIEALEGVSVKVTGSPPIRAVNQSIC